MNWIIKTALSGKDITFINPVSMSGNIVEGGKLQEYKTEFEKLRNSIGRAGQTVFEVK